jgi:hypothetical protein
MSHRYARIEHRDPRLVRTRSRGNDVALIWRVRMRPCVPVCDLILAIVSRVRDHPINMLPFVPQLRLQCQFATNLNETHRLVRRLLFGARFQKKCRCRCQVPKAYVGQIRPFRHVNLQQHMNCWPRRVAVATRWARLGSRSGRGQDFFQESCCLISALRLRGTTGGNEDTEPMRPISEI